MTAMHIQFCNAAILKLYMVTTLFNHSGSGIQSCHQIFIFLPGDIGLPLFPYQAYAPLNCKYKMTVSDYPPKLIKGNALRRRLTNSFKRRFATATSF